MVSLEFLIFNSEEISMVSLEFLHLFQNRYKSLICDEDSYLLELVRYIHLNPLRAGLMTDLSALDVYPWAGHAVIMGKSIFEQQSTEEVLRYFDPKVSFARRKYRDFIADGIPQGKRMDLVGKRTPCDAADASTDNRILGDEGFVDHLRANVALQQKLSLPKSIDSIIATIAKKYEVSPNALTSRSRLPRVLDARAAVCHAAVEEGHSGAEVARRLGMTRSGVSLARRRGHELLAEAGMATYFQQDTESESTN